ncbi:MAG: hypothetical protein Kow0090_04170 [Myxococcota bacterium]
MRELREFLHSYFGRARDEAGVALLVVLTVIAVLTTTVVEFAYSSRVSLHLAANSRDTLRTEYLAYSAFNISRLILHFQSVMEQQMKAISQSIPPEFRMLLGPLANFQLWKIFPSNSSALRGIAMSGLNSLELSDRLSEEDDEEMRVSGIGEFDGDFEWEIDDENRKINLSCLRANPYTPSREITIEQLMRLFLPARYNFLFENRDADGQYTNRYELIAALIDWQDPDTTAWDVMSNLPSTASEDSYYQNLTPQYKAKNAPFDTLMELHLIRGVGDTFFRIFSDMLTVYRCDPQTILNVTTSNRETILATLCAIFKDPQMFNERRLLGCDDPSGYSTRIFWEEFDKWRETAYLQMATQQQTIDPKMVASMPITFNEIVGFLDSQRIAFPRDVLGYTPDKVLADRATVFKVKAHGYLGEARTTITAVIYNQTPGGQIWYFRED